MTELAGKIYDTSVDDFKRIVQRIQTAVQHKDDIMTDHASAWKDAKDKGIHNGALKLCLKLKKQDVAKTADFLRAFDAYCDALDIRSQADMFDQEQSRAADGESIARASEQHQAADPELEPAD